MSGGGAPLLCDASTAPPWRPQEQGAPVEEVHIHNNYFRLLSLPQLLRNQLELP